MAPVALAWTLTLLRCFHSSAHSRSVSLWSITSSGRDPWTAAGGEWTLRTHLMLLGLTSCSPNPDTCSLDSCIGCTHPGKVERVKKMSPSTDPLPTALRKSGTYLASAQGLKGRDSPLTLATLPAPPCLQNLLLSFCPLLPNKAAPELTSGASPLLRSPQGLRVTAWLQHKLSHFLAANWTPMYLPEPRSQATSSSAVLGPGQPCVSLVV